MADRPIPFSGPMVRALLEGRKTQTRRVLKPQPSILKGATRFYRPYPTTDPRQWHCCLGDKTHNIQIVPYARGDLLWVREKTRVVAARDGEIKVRYEADGHEPDVWLPYPDRLQGRPVIGKCLPYGGHREVSRITNPVTDVRVEHVQEISEEDALAEGIIRSDPTPEDLEWHKAWGAEHGYDPAEDPMQPVWLAPGTRQGWGTTKQERDRPQWGPTPQFAFRCLWNALNDRRGAGWDTNPWVAAITFNVHRANIDVFKKHLAAA